MKYSSFDKKNLQVLRTEINALLKAHGIEGLEMSVGNCKFSSGDATFQLSVKIEGAKTFNETLLESQMAFYNLQKTASNGAVLVEYLPKNHKYPFVYAYGGKRYKCDERTARMMFAKR